MKFSQASALVEGVNTMATARARYRSLKKAGELTEVSFRVWARSAYETSSNVEGKLGKIAGKGDRDANSNKKQKAAR